MQDKTSFIVFIQIFAVLNKLLKISGIKEASKIDVSSIFIAEVKKMGLHPEELKVVMSFYKKPVGQLGISFQPSAMLMKKSVEKMYTGLCELIGPVDADKIFGTTINKVATSKAAQIHSPKKFL